MPAPGASLTRLVDIMDRLLAPDGCPWDREQTLETLRPFLVEETYEVLDAMGRDDAEDHCEELGDLMMQIVFQAAIRTRENKFGIDDVVASISDKLVRRHPHVFGDTTGVDTPDQVLAQWEDIKKAEKAAAGQKQGRILSGVKHGPALWRAQKLGAKAGKVGFDWPGWKGSHDKVQEEVLEIAAVADGDDQAAKHHEIGDLLLAVVNLARKLKVDAEVALIDATNRFTSRFEHIEDTLTERGLTPQTSTLEEMDSLWNDAKVIEKARAKR
ncbi:MAG: nucleoside triphosphate pyrophosphohydrolase [Deltaproteobacteria bacterium]|nr:nucleoside triphosphate pyrophosphohydrolase [Deltaproteobacteria bacterium]